MSQERRTPVDQIGGGKDEQRQRILRARHALNDDVPFAAQLLDDWVRFNDEIEAAGPSALEAALEEARELRRLLNEGIELLDADTDSHGTYENWREATLGWQDEARSALVSGGRDGE